MKTLLTFALATLMFASCNQPYCIALGYPDETPEAKPRTMDKIKFIE